ncbi:MAG TPA: PDZ domain-containing protein [Thermoanaerobaculia bacterium]|nr:PDZ domain-containing protein [Thermoanaerobaculia bacterium]
MRRLLCCFLLLLPLAAQAQSDPGTRLLRHPDLHGETIVFVYAGDLWTVGASGGEARRLTADPGMEQFPKFSPDGKQVAFTGQYSGTNQVHVIPADGSAPPKQLTFRNDIGALPPRGGVDNQIFGWTPDGKEVLFKSHRVPWGERNGRPYLVPATGGMERPLQVTESGTSTLSPDGTKLVYTPSMREFRTWKRHKGGRAQDVWIYDLKNDTAERLTDFVGTDNMPVWIGNTIYFTSDRGGWQLNLFAYDLGSRQTRQVTNHDQFDVLWPSGDDRRIVYQQAGYLHVFDTSSGQTRQVPIQVHGDFPATLPYFKNVTADAQSMAVSPTGKRAVLGARGEIFTVPAQKGEIRNLTATPGIREMDAVWSPDGRWIAYLSDRSGEYEVYVRPSDGSGEERRVTTGGKVWRFPPLWSPDSKKIAFGDSDQHLFWVDVQSGKTTEADYSDREDIFDYRWSPDSRWLTYTKEVETQLDSIWVYSLDTRKATRLTSGLTDDTNPVFSPDGRYLYFLSNRDFNLTFSGFEFSYVYTDPTRVYVAVLSKEGPALFLPTSDEEEWEEEGTKPGEDRKPPTPRIADAANAADIAQDAKGGDAEGDDEGPDSAETKAPVRVKIDFDGFESRVRAIPGAPGDYRGLQANSDGIFYRVGDGPQTALKMFDLKAEKEQTVLEGGVGGYELSADGKKVLYRQGDTYGIVDAKPGQKMGDGKLALEKLELRIEPREEWRQMYVDAWRILRDWFYDPNMHGLDWAAMRDRYAALLPYAAHTEDLDWILGDLGAELSAGHVYIQPGERPGPKRVENGLLGAEVEPHTSGFYQVTKIYPGENWHQDFRSPLTEPGVNVKQGHYILEVDGTPTKGVDNFYRLLQNKANRVVTLLVNDKPDTKGAWVERVRPVAREQNLRYLDWVLAKREQVRKASNGRIGYIHLPNTAVEGNRELFKYFYPQTNTDALILDDRYNGGGFVPDQMVELLDRPLLHYWIRRGEQPERVPGFVHTGPKVTLINGQAGSGGDAFPYYFKKMGLGPLIGTKTWGGLIGISGNPDLIDGTNLSAATFRFLDTEGNWGIENEGVAPDIEVIDRPDLVAKGQDPSLEKAIEVLQEELRKNPPAKLKVPAPPRQEWPPN